MEIVGIVLAVLATLIVLFHARYRGLPLWSMILWALGTFLLMIIIFPIYLLIHGPDPKPEEEES